MQMMFQFYSALDGSTPPIYRRIELSQQSSFWELHCTLQDAFGWHDSHLHEFRTLPQKGKLTLMRRIGIPLDDPFMNASEQPEADWDVTLESVFKEIGACVVYRYDFGDCWEHTIRLESIHAPVLSVKYPRCIDGRRACPPEDCGGMHGYQNLLNILRTPSDPEYHDVKAWLKEMSGTSSFDPEYFEAKKIKFGSAKKRLMELQESLK